MSMQETANLIEMLKATGFEANIGDFILGIEGRLSIEEAARICNEGRRDPKGE